MSKIERILEDSFKVELLTPITFLRGVAASRNVYAKLSGGMVIFYEDVNEELNFLQNWRVDDLGSVDIHTTEKLFTAYRLRQERGIKQSDIDKNHAAAEEEFFQREMMVSVYGVYMIAKLISERDKKHELPSEKEVSALLEWLELETIFTVEEFFDVLADEFRFCTDNIMKVFTKKNAELFGLAIQHRVMLYALNPFEENAKFIKAKHISSIPYLEDGTIKKIEFGAVVLVGVQGGVISEEVFIDVLHHLSLMMKSGKLALVHRSQSEDGDEDEGDDDEELDESETEKKPKRKSKKKNEPFHLTGRTELNKYFNDNVIDVVENEETALPAAAKPTRQNAWQNTSTGKPININSSSVGSSLIHETAKKTEEMFKKAKRTAPSVVIIDEMDAFMPDRKRVRNADSHAIEEVSSFLRCLQRATDNKILVIGTTNFIENIDPAILRSGRMGKHLKVEMPNEDEITEVLELEVNKRPHGKINLRNYAKKLTDKPLSDVVAAVRNASMIAAKRRAKQLSTEDMDKGIDELLESSKKEETKSIGFVS
ncbi:unnamed protein product [Cylicocyclus nassatus]|uniref:ATPase AAA-type core domain-containing protein n=1 Tax=Cylicocyclus nassatus TaxID=53992 RepID=A0AA36GH29_CYLNA|nr:unnamed protein product [Cylicocyclus nassatus]